VREINTMRTALRVTEHNIILELAARLAEVLRLARLRERAKERLGRDASHATGTSATQSLTIKWD
jgi:hypothetical protein